MLLSLTQPQKSKLKNRASQCTPNFQGNDIEIKRIPEWRLTKTTDIIDRNSKT